MTPIHSNDEAQADLLRKNYDPKLRGCMHCRQVEECGIPAEHKRFDKAHADCREIAEEADGVAQYAAKIDTLMTEGSFTLEQARVLVEVFWV